MLGALLATGYAALFLFAIRRFRFFAATGLSHRTVGWIFLLKIAAGTVLWYIYTFIHTDRATADIYRYFDDGNIMFSALPEHPGDYLRMLVGIGNDQPRFDTNYYLVMNNWYRQFESNMYNDAHTMIRFNAFVRLFSFGHYHVHTVFACFFGLIGLVGMYRAFVERLKGHERSLLIAVFLLPTVLFWGSGVIKESLLFFGLGLFLVAVAGMVRRGLGVVRIGLLVFCAVLLFFLKFYVIMSMIPALIAYVWCRRTGDRRPLLKFAVVYAIFITLGLNSELFYPRFNILEVLYVKQRDFIGMATAINAGSLVEMTPLEPNVWSFIRRAPYALYLTFLSPLTTWNNGALGLMSALENLAILGAIVMAVLRRRPWREVDRSLLLFCIGYCLLLALVIGWTTPVIGALVRYRAPMLPFLLIGLMCIADPNKIAWPKWTNIDQGK